MIDTNVSSERRQISEGMVIDTHCAFREEVDGRGDGNVIDNTGTLMEEVDEQGWILMVPSKEEVDERGDGD